MCFLKVNDFEEIQKKTLKIVKKLSEECDKVGYALSGGGDVTKYSEANVYSKGGIDKYTNKGTIDYVLILQETYVT